MDRNIAAFLAVARTGNLTQATGVLGLTQPSVGKRIANLEEQLRTPLFERHRRGMTLTVAGERFLERAERIEAEYGFAREEIAGIADAGLSVLRVGAGPLFHLRYVAPLFGRLRDRFPDLNLELIADANVRTIPMLRNHRLDAVMGVIQPDTLDDTIHAKRVTSVEHGIVLRADDPCAAPPRIDPSVLTGKSWVLYAEDPDTQRAIGDYYLPRGIATPHLDVRTSSFATGLQLVAQGNFVMSAPLQLAPVIEKEDLVVRPVLNGMPRREAGIHVRKSSLGFAAIRALLKAFDDTDLGPVEA